MQNPNKDALFEDEHIAAKGKALSFQDQTSPYCDFVYYPSRITPGLRLAMRVTKPAKPGFILAATHGWHMSIPGFEYQDKPDENNSCLLLQIDMRGRAWSTGNPDCNGLELFDIIDGIAFAKERYREYIADPSIVFFESGSGGGGNALALAGKFPDFFAAVTASAPIADYALWYENDASGEFRDEMDVWIGPYNPKSPMAYAARSGLTVADNLLSPLCLIHGETDIRVPVDHARRYAARIKQLGKENLLTYLELTGVGSSAHFGNETEAQQAQRLALPEAHRRQNMHPVSLPAQGELTVAGYVQTKHFSLMLDSQDKVATLSYDLATNRFALSSLAEGSALLQIKSGEKREIRFGWM